MHAYLGVGFHLHLPGYSGGHPRLLCNRRLVFPLLQIPVLALSLRGLDAFLLVRQQLLWLLRLCFPASGGGTLSSRE
jgi:hypothetical protein